MRHVVVAVLGVTIAACVDAGELPADAGASAPDATPPPPPDAAPPGPELGSFQLTYYWIAAEADFSGPADTEIYESDCAVLATVPEAFADSLAIEGTGRLLDGRLVNYWGSCGCPRSPCYFVVDAEHPWGVGAQNRALVPFRSVAVDTDILDIGQPLWIAELDGMTMPGEAPWGAFAHDGCVVADDVGGGITGQHVDFFVALRPHYLTLDGQLGLDAVTLHDGGARCPTRP